MIITMHGVKPTLLDVIEHCTDVEPPSPEAFANLRTLRCVCKDFRHAVATQHSNAAWCALLSKSATNFCHNLSPGSVLAEGEESNAGIRNLIALGEYYILADCMIQYLPHQQTQKSIVAMLRAHLHTDPTTNKPNRRLLREVSLSNMRYSVAEAMRFHVRDSDICIDTANVLSDLYEFLEWSPELVTYIIETTIAMLQQFTGSTVESAKVRFAGIHLLTVFTECSACDAMLHNTRLINIVCEAMTYGASSSNLEMQLDASLTLHRLLIRAGSDVVMETDFVLVEETLLRAGFALRMEQSIVHPLSALLHLNLVFCDTLLQGKRTLELCRRAVTSSGAELAIMKPTFELISAVLRACVDGESAEHSELTQERDLDDKTDLRVIPEASTLIICITTVMLAKFSCTNMFWCRDNKKLCTSAFGVLYLLCRNHASNMQCLVDTDACELLYSKYYTNDVSCEICNAWQLAFMQISDLVGTKERVRAMLS